MPAASVEQYLASLPEDRRAALNAVREVINKNLDSNIKEGMQYGVIGYFIPHSVFPAGYHCNPKEPLPYMGLGSGKSHMSLHMMCGCDRAGGAQRFGAEIHRSIPGRAGHGQNHPAEIRCRQGQVAQGGEIAKIAAGSAAEKRSLAPDSCHA